MPTREDIDNTKKLLICFGEVMGLSTNLQKTSVAAISCNNIDLNNLLTNLPVARTGFPMQYLGLPLAIRRLRRIELQPLIDKVAAKLSTWNVRHLMQAGRLSLTKSVLTSQPVYLLTALKTSK